MVQALELYHAVDKWTEPGEVVQGYSWIRVERATVEAVLEVNEPIDVIELPLELRLPLRRAKELHVLREIPEGCWRRIASLVVSLVQDAAL